MEISNHLTSEFRLTPSRVNLCIQLTDAEQSTVSATAGSLPPTRPRRTMTTTNTKGNRIPITTSSTPVRSADAWTASICPPL